MLVVAVLGLFVNIAGFLVLHGGDRESLNMRGACCMCWATCWARSRRSSPPLSLCATGWTPIDPILSVLVALLILSTAWALMRDAAHLLLEGVPANLDRDAIAADV